MRKSVEVNGTKIQVEFESYLNPAKEIVVLDKLKVLANTIAPYIFVINGVKYDGIQKHHNSFQRKGKSLKEVRSVSLEYDGIKFGDSEKKVIEYILQKEGFRFHQIAA